MNRWELKTEEGDVIAFTAPTAEQAALRVADLYGVTVTATRPSQEPTIRVGFTPDQES